MPAKKKDEQAIIPEQTEAEKNVEFRANLMMQKVDESRILYAREISKVLSAYGAQFKDEEYCLRVLSGKQDMSHRDTRALELEWGLTRKDLRLPK